MTSHPVEADRWSGTSVRPRAAALEELVPAAVKSLKAHLGDGDPAAWRAGLRVLELAYGRLGELLEDEHDPALIDPLDVASMSPLERGRLIAGPLDRFPQLAALAPSQALVELPRKQV
jgi:hypothetical protein